jgi:hypothetical protein
MLAPKDVEGEEKEWRGEEKKKGIQGMINTRYLHVWKCDKKLLKFYD